MDYHILRDMIFNTKNKKPINYYGINFKINYKIKKNIDIFFNYVWDKHSRFNILGEAYKENKLLESYNDSKLLYDKFWNKNINRNLGVGFKIKF